MANVNIRMDDETKKQFDLFCNEVGLSVSAVFNMFAKTVVREQRIPFEITTEIPNEATRKAMENVREGKNLSREFHSVEELMADLEREDEDDE